MSYPNQPDKVYYDLVISNLSGNLKGLPPPILFYNETRSTPLIYDPSSYYLSIVRFSLDTSTLPVFVPEIQLQQDNPNLTVYSFTISWTDPASGTTYDAQEYMKFIPQDETKEEPLPPSKTSNGFQDNSTGYYFVFNFQFIVFLINNTLDACYKSLQAKVSGLPSNYAPVMTWNSDSNKAILYTDVLGYDLTLANPMKVFMNSSMTQLFNSFPLKIISYGNTGDLGKNTQIMTNSFGYANVVPFPGGSSQAFFDAIVIDQEFSTISSINPVMSIVFCSNSLPIVSNNISKPLLIYQGSALMSSGNNNLIANVITDLQLDGSYKPNILYQPQGQYRLIDMVGSRPLIDVDISVFWRDRFGALNSFFLSAGSTCTLKILFTKKHTE